MNLLTTAQTKKFNEDYPTARAFLNRCHLQNEYEILKARPALNEWEESRLQELAGLQELVKQARGKYPNLTPSNEFAKEK